jgi:hypothetical protein
MRRLAKQVEKHGYPINLTAQIAALLAANEKAWQAYRQRSEDFDIRALFFRCAELANSKILDGEQKLNLVNRKIDVSDLEAKIAEGAPLALAIELYDEEFIKLEL